MKKFRTIVSVIMMCLAGIVGLFFGEILDEAMGGAILFSMIAGIACNRKSGFVIGKIRRSRRYGKRTCLDRSI